MCRGSVGPCSVVVALEESWVDSIFRLILAHQRRRTDNLIALAQQGKLDTKFGKGWQQMSKF